MGYKLYNQHLNTKYLIIKSNTWPCSYIFRLKYLNFIFSIPIKIESDLNLLK